MRKWKTGLATMAILTVASPALADPSDPRLAPVQPPAPTVIQLPGMSFDGGRVGLGIYEGSLKRSSLGVRDALAQPRPRKAPGIGLKLAF